MRHSVKGVNQGRGLTATRETGQRTAKATREVMATGNPAWTDNTRTQDRIQKEGHGRCQVSTPLLESLRAQAACPCRKVALVQAKSISSVLKSMETRRFLPFC